MPLALLIALLTLQVGRPAVPAPPDDPPSSDRVREAAQRALEERYPDEADRLEVRVKRVSEEVTDTASLRLAFRADGGVPRGTTQARLYAGSDLAGWHDAGWALLYVAHFDSVLVARSSRRPGEALWPEDVTAAWMETTTLRDAPLDPAAYRSMAAAGSAFAARFVREGQALRRSDVRPAYAAEAGVAVVMHYRRSGLSLALRCKAREPGHAGDAIRVYADDTGKTYRARLTGPGTAEWIETL